MCAIAALDHVERFVERVALRHGLPEERLEKDVKEKVFASAPRFVHLQPVTTEGYVHEITLASSGGCYIEIPDVMIA